MHLVQILLPLFDNDGRATSSPGASAASPPSPALPPRACGGGTGGRTSRDEVVVLEVMVPDLDGAWWRAYREGLEARLRQEEVVVRALPMARL
jgi:hypothetical protein